MTLWLGFTLVVCGILFMSLLPEFLQNTIIDRAWTLIGSGAILMGFILAGLGAIPW